MHALLTTLFALTGAGLATWGFARALRHRFSVRDRVRSIRGRRSGVILYAVGGLLLLVPDLLAAQAVTPAVEGNEVAAVVGTMVALIWRAAVVLGVSVGALILWLTSEQVTRPVQGGLVALAGRVPRAEDLRLAVERRRTGLADFPREWGQLIEHDRVLARRLLGQGNHFEAAVLSVATVGPPARQSGFQGASASGPAGAEDLSALRDWDDPVTRRAMEALVECDRLRTPLPPRGTRDVLGSDYGRAVAAFDAAVQAAEDNARARAAHGPR